MFTTGKPCDARPTDWPVYPPSRTPFLEHDADRSLPELLSAGGPTRVTVPQLAPFCMPPPAAHTSYAGGKASIVLAPGGAYKWVGAPGIPETDSVVRWLCCGLGVATFVLKYRVPTVGPPLTPERDGRNLSWGDAALMDAQRAVRLVRSLARSNASLGLDPQRVGFRLQVHQNPADLRPGH